MRATHSVGRIMLLGLAALTLSLNAVPHVTVRDQVGAIGTSWLRLRIAGRLWTVPCCANAPLERPDQQFDRAVILIHGIDRRADFTYDALLNAARHAGHAEASTLLITPQFLNDSDVEAHAVGMSVPYWSSSRWAQGDQSLTTPHNPRHGSISSFDVVDTMLTTLADRRYFPKLRTVVVAGHSAGGQFVNRYAAGNELDSWMAGRGIHVRYVEANAGSYLYLSDERPVAGAPGAFARPSAAAMARARYFNTYKYGLLKLNNYMKRASAQRIIAQLPGRDITYLVGERDTDPRHIALDRTPSALLQGLTRRERGENYFRYLRHTFGPSILRTHRLEVVSRAAHSARRMFDSAAGARWLFDRRPGRVVVAAGGLLRGQRARVARND